MTPFGIWTFDKHIFHMFLNYQFASNTKYFLSLTETEGQSARSVNVPWGPLYCVLQQDEQTLTSYCSEELSVRLSQHFSLIFLLTLYTDFNFLTQLLLLLIITAIIING